jgi:phage replication O-like protein O
MELQKMTKFAVNSFQVPNSLVDLQLSSMSGNALKCLLYIIRKTRGFHKETDRIAASQFIKSCGIAKNTVLSALIELEGLGLIKKDKAKKQNGWNTYSLTSLFDEGEVNKLKAKNGSSKNELVQKLNCAENEPNGAKFEPQGVSFPEIRAT